MFLPQYCWIKVAPTQLGSRVSTSAVRAWDICATSDALAVDELSLLDLRMIARSCRLEMVNLSCDQHDRNVS